MNTALDKPTCHSGSAHRQTLDMDCTVLNTRFLYMEILIHQHPFTHCGLMMPHGIIEHSTLVVNIGSGTSTNVELSHLKSGYNNLRPFLPTMFMRMCCKIAHLKLPPHLSKCCKISRNHRPCKLCFMSFSLCFHFTW